MVLARKQLLGGAIHFMEFQGKPIICLSPFDASCFPTGEPAGRVRSDVMGCNCNGAASGRGAHIKVGGKKQRNEKGADILHSLRLPVISHTLRPSLLSTTRVRAVADCDDQPVFERHCLKCVREAERKIFPSGSLRPTWVPFIPQRELLGDSVELGAHQLSVF